MQRGSRSRQLLSESISSEGLAAKEPSLLLRARIIQAIRAFFVKEGFLEVETPIRIPAPAPEANIDAVRSNEKYLHTSPELAMKRLLAAGYEKIFQICHCFRSQERGRLHLPEFTMVEWYRRGEDYESLMTDLEGLFSHIQKTLPTLPTLLSGGKESDSTTPWQRLTVEDAFLKYTETTAKEALANGSFDEVMAFEIEPKLGVGAPTFLVDYPKELAALSKVKVEDTSLAERFELYIAGVELANGFSELADPDEQRARFEKEREARKADSKDPYPMPEPFLKDLEFMGEAAGIALGVDRVVMLFTGATKIDEVVAFTPEDL